MQAREAAAHVLLPTAPVRSFDQPGSRSAQQAAAAWAWLERAGATSTSPRSADGLAKRGAAASAYNKVSNSPQPATRFRKEFLASLAELHNATTLDGPCSPDHLWLRCKSFHGVRSQQRSHGDGDGDGEDLPPSNGRGHYASNHDDVQADSNLLDRSELESWLRQLRHLDISVPGFDGGADCTTGDCDGRSEPTHVKTDKSTYPAEITAGRGRSGDSDRGGRARNGQSCSKDDLHGHEPDLLHQLLRLRIVKSASSPALCSTIATAHSSKGSHRPYPPHKARPSPKVKLQKLSCKSPSALHQEVVDWAAVRSKQLRHRQAAAEGREEEKTLDHLHSHSHSHVHHHHHHHYHLLHHAEVDQPSLIMSQHGRSSPKLQDLQEKATMLRPAHYYLDRNGRPTPKYHRFHENIEQKSDARYLLQH